MPQREVNRQTGCAKADRVLGYASNCDVCYDQGLIPPDECPLIGKLGKRTWSSMRARRWVEIHFLYAQGNTVNQIVAKTSASESTVRRKLRRSTHLHPIQRRYGRKGREDRNKEIRELYASGLFLIGELAEDFKLSRQTISKILWKKDNSTA